MKKISIIYPTRNRPEMFRKTLELWVNNAQNKIDLEVIISVDEDDSNAHVDETIKYIKSQHPAHNLWENDIFKVVVNKNRSAIEAINNGAKVATNDILLVISDDFSCYVWWDEALQRVVENKNDFLLKTDDQLQPTLVTLPIMDKTYYNRFGYIYHPHYLHMWSDTEMTAVAIMNGRYVKTNLLFPHNHYSTGKFKKDDISLRNDATWSQGQNLFNQRLKSNFGLKDSEIVKPYSEIVWR